MTRSKTNKNSSKNRPPATPAGTGQKRSARQKTKRSPGKTRHRGSCALHVITDGTGGLPRHMLAAVLSQFPRVSPSPAYDVFCNTPEKLQTAARKLKADTVVLFAITDPGLKKLLLEQLTEREIPAYDMVGGLVNFVAQATRQAPVNDLHRIHRQDELYFDRIDAWEFTLQHDDSRRLESLDEADIILLGLSRVSKTPTAAYLGWLGYRVANVSFAPEIGLPNEVKACRRKVIALTIKPKKLADIRLRRLQHNGFQQAVEADSRRQFRYADVRDTRREVMAAEAIYKKLRVPTIDITDLTVEETAAQILTAIRTRRRRPSV